MIANIVTVPAGQGEVFDVADPARPGKVIKAGPEISEVRFEDGAVPALSEQEFADQLEALARDIQHFERQAVFRIANRLAKAHELFRYRRDEGGFQGWVENRLYYSRSHAYRLLDVNKLTASFPSWDTFGTLSASAIYQLAAPSTPNEVRNEIADRVKAGEKLSCADVQKTIKRAKGQVSDAEPKTPGKSDQKTEQESFASDGGHVDSTATIYGSTATINGSNAKPIVVSEVEVEPKGKAGEEEKPPSPRELWGKWTPQERRDLFQVIGIDEFVAVLPAHLRQGLEDRLTGLHLRGLQRSTKLTKLLRTALKSRSQAEQITALVNKFNKALAEDNIDLEKVHVVVPK